MTPTETLNHIAVLLNTAFTPQQHIVHKPTMKGTGQALKLQLRLEPLWVESAGGGFFDKQANKDGGLFLEIAPQGGKDAGNNPTFLWKDASKLVRCKLGIPDITGLLVAIREWRIGRTSVPSYLQDRNSPKENQVSLFHKYNNGSTIISYTFDDAQSVLRISKGKDQARSISLTLGEEVIFEKFLNMALEAYLKVGKR